MPKFKAQMVRVVKETYTVDLFTRDKLEAEDIVNSKYKSVLDDSWKRDSISNKWERSEPEYKGWTISKATPETIQISIQEIEDSKFTPSVVIDDIEWVNISVNGESCGWKERKSLNGFTDEFVSYDTDVAARFAACEYVMERENPNWWKRYAS